jgi:P4 family phage/plasmid primase-like protien
MLDLKPILEAKRNYGWRIIFGDATKSPEICGKWKVPSQTEQELEQLYEKVKEHAENWGPITGNGLLAFDFDWPWVFGLWHHYFKDRADTLIMETPNGGARVFYHTTEEAPGDPFKENLHLEIKTNHYVAAGGQAITQDGDLKPYNTIQNLPIKTDNNILTDTIIFMEDLLEGKYNWLNYRCIGLHLDRCKKRIVIPHELGLAVANFMLSSGCEEWEVHNLRRSTWDYKDGKYRQEYDEKETQKHIDSTQKFLKREGKPPKCKTLLDAFKLTKDICKGCPRKAEITTKTTFKSVDYIKDLITRVQLKTVETTTSSDTIWKYNEARGIWEEDGIPYIEKELRDILGNKLKPKHLAETTRITKVYTYIKPEQFTEDPGSLPLQNGEYDFISQTLQPFNPDHNHRSRLPIKYDPNADCPLFKKFLTEVAPSDENTIQELFGYLLVKGYPIQKCFIFQGSGANGKSTLLRVMEHFIGKENISSVSLFDLVTKTFSKAELYNKFANITPDIGADELKRTGIFKALTGGDTITAERKNQHPFQFTNYAKMIFSCNQLPTSPDNSDAFFRRFMIFQFKQVFDDKNADRALLEKITTEQELSGVFNWALIGYGRLMQKMNFTESRSTIDTKELYLRMSDPLNAFVNDMIDDDPEGVTIKDDLYRYYNEYCIAKGYIALSYVRFFMSLKGRIFTQDTQVPRGDQRIRALKGLRIKLATNDLSAQATQAAQANLGRKENLDFYSVEIKVSGDSDLPVQPVQPVQEGLRERLEVVAKGLREHQGTTSSDLASGLGLPEEEVRKLLKVLQRDGVAFETIGDRWRWQG